MSSDISKKELISFRTGNEGDLPLIYASWLKGLYYGNSLYGDINADLYYSVYHRVLEVVLASPKTEIKVAVLKEDPDVILGYSIAEGNTLHWVFVKSAWRGIGLSKDLMPCNLVTITHLTKAGRAIWKKSYSKASFNPFLEHKA